MFESTSLSGTAFRSVIHKAVVFCFVLLSPGDGFKWNQRDLVIGKTTKAPIPKDEIIYESAIQ